MATAQDVIDALTEKTDKGEVSWKVGSWDDDGKPRRWDLEVGDCTFSAFIEQKALRMSNKDKNGTVFGQGEDTERLFELLSYIGERKQSRDELLLEALHCLEGKC